MKPEYQDFMVEVLRQERLRFSHDLTTAEMVRGRCEQFVRRLHERFPHLRVVAGFVSFDEKADYPGSEHWWLVDRDGSIVDPTRVQFGRPGQEMHYVEFDPEVHEVRLGTCPNCGRGIYGRESQARQFCDRACEQDYADYLSSFS